METNTNQRNHKIGDFQFQAGCLSILAFIVCLLVIFSTVWTFVRILLSSLIGIKPIDDETGEYISIPWLGSVMIIGIAITLFFIEQGYYYLKQRFKKP